jgi:hypothetical protein
MNRLEFSCCANFICICMFKKRVEYVFFLLNPLVEGTVNSRNKRLESSVKLLSKNSISVNITSLLMTVPKTMPKKILWQAMSIDNDLLSLTY